MLTWECMRLEDAPPIALALYTPRKVGTIQPYEMQRDLSWAQLDYQHTFDIANDRGTKGKA